MRLFVTVAEAAADDAVRIIRELREDHDGIELRAELLGDVDLRPIREATRKPLLLTYRGGGPIDEATIRRGIDAGFDLIDVEWAPHLDREMLSRYASRIVISHHDYEAMGDVDTIMRDMRSLGCAHVKLAATPRTLADNLSLLALQREGDTVIGMGERGAYTRILAPFRGAELAFVAVDAARRAAPGQLTLDEALLIYGLNRADLRAEKVFAVAGNPASHSRSPLIHNPLFRERGLAAAYTIASAEQFSEVAALLDSGELAGVSVTAPFKEDAFALARARGARIAINTEECGSVNTLYFKGGALHADNTDVDGYLALLGRMCGTDRKTVAIVGAGGTARAALVAARRLALDAVVFNRTRERGEALAARFGARAAELGDLPRFQADVVVDTTPSAEFDVRFDATMTYLRAAYGNASPVEDRARRAGAAVIDGRELLEAQAVRQNELFAGTFE